MVTCSGATPVTEEKWRRMRKPVVVVVVVVEASTTITTTWQVGRAGTSRPTLAHQQNHNFGTFAALSI